MSADGSIVIKTNIDDKNAQKELNRLNRQIKSLEEQLASKKQGRLPLEDSLNAVNTKLNEARKQLAILQDEQNAINAAMQPGVSPDDYMRAYSDKPMVDAALKQQQKEVDAIEKEWTRANKALSDYDTKVSSIEGKLNRSKEEAGGIQRNMAMAGPAADKMAKSIERSQKSAGKFSMRLREVLRSALVFTVVSQALAEFREWMGKVVTANDETRAAIARLKGSLLTLAQPLIEVIIPAFTRFVDMLTRIVSMAARFTAALFGTTADKASDAAENLYEETDAIESTGEAAKEAEKSLASFDEINQLAGGKEKNANQNQQQQGQPIKPDFSVVKNSVQDAISAILEMLVGTALLAIGAVLTFTGANIPIGLALMVMGALSIVDAVTSNPDAIKTLLQGGLGEALTAIGPLVAVIGVLLTVMGHLAIGISLIIFGSSIWSVGKAFGDEGDFVQNILTRLSQAATAIGPLIAVIGVLLVVMGRVLQGVAFIVAGAALWSVGKAFGDEGDFVQNILTRLQEAAAVIGPLIAVIGIVLLVANQIAIGIGLIIAGIALWSFGVADFDGGNGIGSAIVSALLNVFTQIGPYIALIGVMLVFVPGMQAVGIGMIVAGVAMFAAGEIGMNWELLSTDLVTGLLTILNDISPYIALLGLILIFVPGMQAIGIGLLIAGIGLFAFTEISLNWDSIVDMLSSALEAIKNWWNTNVAKFFTLEYWKDLGENIINGFLDGLKAAWETVVSWAKGVVDWFKNLFTGASDSANISVNSATASSGNGKMYSPRLALKDIPALARGAVIPPNREFLAVLGDQKNGKNIEAPVSEIEAAVARGMQNSGGGSQTVILEVDRQVLGRVTYQLNKEQTRRFGVDLVGV